jgi:hypothetical protein
MKTIKEVIMKRDGYSETEANNLINAAKEDLENQLKDWNFMEAENICYKHFGLEPEYLFELLEK